MTGLAPQIRDWEATPRQLTITVVIGSFDITAIYRKKKLDGKWYHVYRKPAILGGFYVEEGAPVAGHAGDGLDMAVAEHPEIGCLLPHYMKRETVEVKEESSDASNAEEYVVVDVFHPGGGQIDRTLAIPFGEVYSISYKQSVLNIRMVEVKKRRV